MSKERVIEAARGEIGYTEYPPGSNKVKYWDEYDPKMQGQPWCVSGIWWVFRQAGEGSAFFGGAKTASCGTLLRWYKALGMIVPFTEAQAGDIVFLTFHSSALPEHCGLVTGRSGVLLKTIEFNTSALGSQDNGGIVCEKTRYPYQVVAVARPQYKPEEPVPVDDITGHWAEQSIRRAMDKGLMQGYPDGSWKPDQPVTRAELAVILDRLDKGDDLK